MAPGPRTAVRAAGSQLNPTPLPTVGRRPRGNAWSQPRSRLHQGGQRKASLRVPSSLRVSPARVLQTKEVNS
jgi:hypothetical protein